MTVVKAKLPWPPSANHMYKHSGPVFLKPKCHEFREEVVLSLLEAKPKPKKTEANVKLTMHAYPPDLRKRDLDNVIKSLGDAITSSCRVWEDDRQVKELHVYWKEPDRPKGRVDIEVEEIGE